MTLAFEDAVLGLPLPRARHSVPEAIEARGVLGELEPLEVPERRVEREVEGRDPLRGRLGGLRGCGPGRGHVVREVDVNARRGCQVGEGPVRQAGAEFDRLVATARKGVSLVSQRKVRVTSTHVRATNAATPSVSVYFWSGL